MGTGTLYFIKFPRTRFLNINSYNLVLVRLLACQSRYITRFKDLMIYCTLKYVLFLHIFPE